MGFVYQVQVLLAHRQVLIRCSVLVHTIFVALPYRPIPVIHWPMIFKGLGTPALASPSVIVFLGLPWQLSDAPENHA